MVSGPLSYYKGDIPEDNLDEILATKTTLDSLTDNKYSNRDNALITNVKVNVRRISTPNPYSRYNFYREEPVSNGLIGTTGKSFTADKLKRSINVAITGRFNANVVTRRYGLRQQVLYLMYYGIE